LSKSLLIRFLFLALVARRLLVHLSAGDAADMFGGLVRQRLGHGWVLNFVAFKLGDEGRVLDLLNDDLVCSDVLTDIFAARLAYLLAAVYHRRHLLIAADLDDFLLRGTVTVMAVLGNDLLVLAFFLDAHLWYLLTYIFALVDAFLFALFHLTRLVAFHSLDFGITHFEIVATFLLLVEAYRFGAVFFATDFGTSCSSRDGEKSECKEKNVLHVYNRSSGV